MPWRDVQVLVHTFAGRDECETHRALNPDWRVSSAEVQLLREVEFGTRVGAWLQTEDARKRRNQPKRIPLTKAEQFAATPERERFDLRTRDEIDAMIGWDKGGVG